MVIGSDKFDCKGGVDWGGVNVAKIIERHKKKGRLYGRVLAHQIKDGDRVYMRWCLPYLHEKAQAVRSQTELFDLSSRGGLDFVFLSGAQIDTHSDVNRLFIGDPANLEVRFLGGACGCRYFTDSEAGGSLSACSRLKNFS